VDRGFVRNQLASPRVAAHSGPYARNRRHSTVGTQTAHDAALDPRDRSEGRRRCHAIRQIRAHRDSTPSGIATANHTGTGSRAATATCSSGGTSCGRNDDARDAARACGAASSRVGCKSPDLTRAGRTARAVSPAGSAKQATGSDASTTTSLADNRAFDRQVCAYQACRGARTREAGSRRNGARSSTCEAGSRRRATRGRQADATATPKPSRRPGTHRAGRGSAARECRFGGAEAHSAANWAGTPGEPGAAASAEPRQSRKHHFE